MRQLQSLQTAFLGLLLSITAGLVFAQEAKIEGDQRNLAMDMLLDVHNDVRNDYYDSKYHGVDIAARYQLATELIKKATSFNQALGAVAWYLDPLNDSHTFFAPPERAYHHDYGWRMQMIGDRCLVTAVKPETDAEKQGLHPGDQILAIGSIEPTRDSLPKLEYVLNLLRPQPSVHVLTVHPNGEQRTLDIKAEIVRSQQLITADNFWREIVEAEMADHQYARRSYSPGKDVLIWKLPDYDMNEKGVDALMGEALGYKALVLDLRNNPGGRAASLDRMVANLFDHDITIGTLESRKKTEKLTSKSRGSKAFSGKLIVIIDSQSGSAAEIFSRIVQIEKRGTVIGDRSAGAVMMARSATHSVGLDKIVYYGVSITIGNIVLTDGKSLEHVGVTPDEGVWPTPEDLASGRDPALARAVTLAGGQLSAEEAGKLFPVKWIKYQ